MLSGLLKYLLEGIAVGVSTYLVSKKSVNVNEILMISLTAAATFALLDMLAPSISEGARKGAGFGLGAKHVGFGENFQEEEPTVNESSVEQNSNDISDLKQGLNEMNDRLSSLAQKIPGTDDPARRANRRVEEEDLDEDQGMDADLVEIPKTEPVDDSGDELLDEDKDEEDKDEEDKDVEGFVGFGSNIHNSRLIMENFQGGAPATAPAAPAAAPAAPVVADPAADPAADPEAAALGTVNPMEGGNESTHLMRKSGVVYSGDLIKILNQDKTKIFQRSVSSSEVLMREPIPNKVLTNLSKVRLEKVGPDGHSLNKQVMIKFGDTIHIKHSVNDNSINVDRFIKIGYLLQSHQYGPLFRKFTIFKPGDTTNNDPVRYGEPFVLQNHKVGSFAAGFLDVQPDGTINNKKTEIGQVTQPFVLALNRVYEIGNRNLCVCPNEVLYP